jgi:hypothetical protein
VPSDLGLSTNALIFFNPFTIAIFVFSPCVFSIVA